MSETPKLTLVPELPPSGVVSDIVMVDAIGRGHRPSYNGVHDPKAPGGQFLSNYEMSMIGENADQILGCPPKEPGGVNGSDEPPIPPDPIVVPPIEPPTSPADVWLPPRTPRRPMTARERINAVQATTKEADDMAKREHAKEEANTWNEQEKLTPEKTTPIEVIRRVPKIQEMLLRSKYLSGLALRRYREESFTLLEYHAGIRSANHGTRLHDPAQPGHGTIGSIKHTGSPRDMGDRRAPRFVVSEKKKGIILPHVVRGDDRGRKRLPDARLPSTPESKRRDALVISEKGGTWAGGLHSQDREAIAVGPNKGLGVIGVDSRIVARRTWIGRKTEGFVNFLGFDRRRTPNGIADAMPRVVDGSASVQRDITVKTARIRAGGPAQPPHPRQRRTPAWQHWGTNNRFRTSGRSGTMPTTVPGPPPRIAPGYAPRNPERRVI